MKNSNTQKNATYSALTMSDISISISILAESKVMKNI